MGTGGRRGNPGRLVSEVLEAGEGDGSGGGYSQIGLALEDQTSY